MMKKSNKKEALSVSRLITEVLVDQLNIPFRNIVNDTTFSKYTGSKRPDLLISEYEYNEGNETQYIENLIAYAEAKDSNCNIGDADWIDAIEQGKVKSKKLGLNYFIVTNCKTAIFYNAKNIQEISLNDNPIREFQTMDILRLINKKINDDNDIVNISTNVDTLSTISEAVFNKKLWELANVYRQINFKDNVQKIDFTVGFIAMEYFEEKCDIDKIKDKTKIYWSQCNDKMDIKLVGNLAAYISYLESNSSFNEFKNLMELVKGLITSEPNETPLVSNENVRLIYEIIDSMKPLHGAGFDLFGAVYEMFASSKEKKDFGEYFTRRHYTHVFSKLLLNEEVEFKESHEFKIIDPACGTGGFLTESFKVLKNNYKKSSTYNSKTKEFLSKKCFYGIDVRKENISRTRLNMFLVGDGHTNMYDDDTLVPKKEDSINILNMEYDYVITNPPYGNGTVKAETSSISTIRNEIAFICKVIKLLTVGGKACIITPDGVLENPSYKLFRKELLEKCDILSIISLPKFAFAPYTKEKTYAIFIQKRGEKFTKIQEKPIWMYIIDNDGLANSDKRFPTKLRFDNNSYMHDEISGYVDNNGVEKPGLLEQRWMKYDDLTMGGTEWINEQNKKVKKRKGGYININYIIKDKYYTLLPEYYLRPYEPNYITISDLTKEVDKICKKIKEFGEIYEASRNI